ncbi:MAG TPA: MATE family efflux transporter [Ignavibacteriaceae bacterium]|nr:MATE family efflux transporter [Ignavibacteriaceae bacterium]
MQNFKIHIKNTLILAYPVIIGQLGYIMMGVVDSLMVGNLGATPLAAAALANSIFMVILVVGIGISFAITPLVAILVGAEKHSECGVIFRQALLVDMLSGLILMSVVFIGTNFLAYLNQPEEVVTLARSYLNILGFSILPVMLFQTYKQFIEGLSVMRPAMILTIIANFINAFLNWIFIYGNLGFESMGLDGAGWATFGSRLFMGIGLMWFVMTSSNFKQYDVTFHFRKIDYKVIKKILGIGLPSAFQYIFEVGAFSFAAVMIGWLGTKELAAHQIAINLASISFMCALGVSAAGSIRVGNAVGKQDIKEIRRAGFSAIFIGQVMMGSFGVLFIIFNNLLPSLYISDPAVISMAATLLIIASIFQIADGTQAVGIGILRGLTDVKVPTIITFVAYWILGLPIGYVLGFTLNMGVKGVWIGLLIGLTGSAIMLSLRFNHKSRQKIAI